jgi:hypothetical protein
MTAFDRSTITSNDKSRKDGADAGSVMSEFIAGMDNG